MVSPMATLDEYLREEEITNGEFGSRIGKTGEAVRRYRTGERWPDPDTMAEILAASNGRVTPNDFLRSRRAAPEETTSS